MLANFINPRQLIFAAGLGIAASLLAPGVLADAGHNHAPAAAETSSQNHEPMGGLLAMPMMNAGRGMVLFAEKGCVACHSINGVGGHDATPLDAHEMEGMMNPFDFSAKMW